MTHADALTRENLRTPKAAAIAGMLFSLLTVTIFWLLWNSVPADPQEPGLWLTTNSHAVTLGLNLVPFAGIAFLWFMGVLRDRLGERGSVLCNGVLWKRDLVSGYAIWRFGHRWCHTH